MGNDWILDVIRDLRRFADLNNMPELARQLEVAAGTAAKEIMAKGLEFPGGTSADAPRTGRTLPRSIETGPDA